MTICGIFPAMIAFCKDACCCAELFNLVAGTAAGLAASTAGFAGGSATAVACAVCPKGSAIIYGARALCAVTRESL